MGHMEKGHMLYHQRGGGVIFRVFQVSTLTESFRVWAINRMNKGKGQQERPSERE